MNKNFEKRNRDVVSVYGAVGVLLIGGILLGLLLVDGVSFLSKVYRLHDGADSSVDIIKLMSMYFGGR